MTIDLPKEFWLLLIRFFQDIGSAMAMEFAEKIDEQIKEEK